MLRRTALAILTTLAFIAPLAPLTAQAGQKTRERLRIVGYSTVASWDYIDGNIGTFVNVVVTENDESGTAGPSETAFVSLSISRYDVDTGNVLITGVANVDGSQNFDFNIDRNLGTARLIVNNAIFQDDNSFTFFTVDMDLTWTATADAVHAKSHTNDKSPGLKEKTRFHGTFRDGVATGSILGKNIPTGTMPTIQFTPVASSLAQLQFNQFGSKVTTTTTP